MKYLSRILPPLPMFAMLTICFVVAALWVYPDWSFAATDNAPKADLNTVNALPWYQSIEPYLQALWQALVAAGIAAGAAIFYKFTGIKVEESDRQAIQTQANNAAGRILAGIEGPVSNIKFDLGKGPYAGVIAQEIEHIRATIPESLERRDVTPDKLAKTVLGKLGQLQQGTIAAPH